MSIASSSPSTACDRLSLLIASLLVLTGTLVLLGWWTHFYPIVHISPGFPGMKANTAACIIFLGIALSSFSLNLKYKTLIRILSGLAIFFLAGSSMFSNLTNLNLHTDQLIAVDLISDIKPGRMSDGTAITLLLATLLFLTTERWPSNLAYLFDIIFAATLSVPLIVITTYLYNPADLFMIEPLSTMALHTALSILAFLLGLALLINTNSALQFLQCRTPGSNLFRKTLALSVFTTIMIGMCIVYFITNRNIGAGIAVAFGSTVVIILTAVLMVRIAERHYRNIIEAMSGDVHRKLLEQQLVTLLGISADAVFLFDKEGNILHANKSAEDIFGWRIDELKKMHLSDLVPGRFRKAHREKVRGFISKKASTATNQNPLNMIGLNRWNEEIPINITITKKTFDGETLIAAIVRDASTIYNELHTLQEETTHDALTGVENRRALDTELKKHSSGLRREDDIALIILDIDFFKHINDTYGHQTGDIVLRKVSHCCTSLLRENDRIFRYGGEEFVIIVYGTNYQDALKLAERLREAVSNLDIHPDLVDDFTIQATISLGVAMADNPGKSLNEVLLDADHALYDAKQQGRNQVVAAAA